MSRVARRKARELREQWLAGLTGGPVTIQPVRHSSGSGRGADYQDAPREWVCNRKKAYPSEEIARSVATRLNVSNANERTARPGFFGVTVNAYGCGRCGLWHLGR